MARIARGPVASPRRDSEVAHGSPPPGPPPDEAAAKVAAVAATAVYQPLEAQLDASASADGAHAASGAVPPASVPTWQPSNPRGLDSLSAMASRITPADSLSSMASRITPAESAPSSPTRGGERGGGELPYNGPAEPCNGPAEPRNGPAETPPADGVAGILSAPSEARMHSAPAARYFAGHGPLSPELLQAELLSTLDRLKRAEAVVAGKAHGSTLRSSPHTRSPHAVALADLPTPSAASCTSSTGLGMHSSPELDAQSSSHYTSRQSSSHASSRSSYQAYAYASRQTSSPSVGSSPPSVERPSIELAIGPPSHAELSACRVGGAGGGGMQTDKPHLQAPQMQTELRPERLALDAAHPATAPAWLSTSVYGDACVYGDAAALASSLRHATPAAAPGLVPVPVSMPSFAATVGAAEARPHTTHRYDDATAELVCSDEDGTTVHHCALAPPPHRNDACATAAGASSGRGFEGGMPPPPAAALPVAADAAVATSEMAIAAASATTAAMTRAARAQPRRRRLFSPDGKDTTSEGAEATNVGAARGVASRLAARGGASPPISPVTSVARSATTRLASQGLGAATGDAAGAAVAGQAASAQPLGSLGGLEALRANARGGVGSRQPPVVTDSHQHHHRGSTDPMAPLRAVHSVPTRHARGGSALADRLASPGNHLG